LYRNFSLPRSDLDMNSLLSQIARLIHSPIADNAPHECVAQNLMERAEAGAGRDPHEAEELRSAARAYLSVVR
jgi:hypothetical protein